MNEYFETERMTFRRVNSLDAEYDAMIHNSSSPLNPMDGLRGSNISNRVKEISKLTKESVFTHFT